MTHAVNRSGKHMAHSKFQGLHQVTGSRLYDRCSKWEQERVQIRQYAFLPYCGYLQSLVTPYYKDKDYRGLYATSDYKYIFVFGTVLITESRMQHA